MVDQIVHFKLFENILIYFWSNKCSIYVYNCMILCLNLKSFSLICFIYKILLFYLKIF